MIHMLRFFAVSLLTTLLLVSPAPAAAGGDRHARAVDTVNRLLNDAHEALSGGGNQRLDNAISPYFAFEHWTRFLIKPRKGAFNPSQRRRVLGLLPGYIANLYHQQFAQGLAQRPSVGGTRRARKDVLVASKFPRTRGKSLPIDWRVRKFRNGETRIIDIMIGGTSFMLLKREEFRDIIDRKGPEGLIIYLERNSR